jgi:lactate permease
MAQMAFTIYPSTFTFPLIMTWTQIYNPLGNLLLSALVASLPVVLLGLLALFHVRAHVAALWGLAASMLVAIFIYGMPASLALASAANGALFGLFPSDGSS